MRAMVIRHEKNLASCHVCPGCKISRLLGQDRPVEPIQTYYSDRQAYDAGWRTTTNRRWCKPGEEAVWICPGCAKGVTP